MTDPANSSMNGVRRTRLILMAAMAPPLGLAFMLSQFLRTAPAVIAPNLRTELDLSAAELSSLSAALFLGSALMQLPVGVLLDRIGPRRTISGFVLITAAGTLGISAAQSPLLLGVSLFVIGCGIAPVYMGLIVLLSRWVPRDRLATASSISVAVGGAGLLLSASPFAVATEWIGWRTTLAVIGLAAVALSVAIWATVREIPPGAPPRTHVPETLGETIRGLGQVLSNRRLYGLAGMAAMSVGSFMSVRSLWAGPYLNDVYGLGLVDRGNVILAMSVAWLVSALLFGPLDRRFDTRRGVVSFGAVVMVAMLVMLAVDRGGSLTLTTATLILFGLSASFSAAIFAHARSLFPDRYVGRVITAINLCTWGGVFVIQMVTGLIVNAFPADAAGRSPQAAYQVLFAVLAVALIIALLFYRRIADVPPSRDMGEG